MKLTLGDVFLTRAGGQASFWLVQVATNGQCYQWGLARSCFSLLNLCLPVEPCLPEYYEGICRTWGHFRGHPVDRHCRLSVLPVSFRDPGKTQRQWDLLVISVLLGAQGRSSEIYTHNNTHNSHRCSCNQGVALPRISCWSPESLL